MSSSAVIYEVQLINSDEPILLTKINEGDPSRLDGATFLVYQAKQAAMSVQCSMVTTVIIPGKAGRNAGQKSLHAPLPNPVY